MRDSKKGNANKLTKLSGINLHLQGEGNMQDRRYKNLLILEMV
jgi:hypothetical protein